MYQVWAYIGVYELSDMGTFDTIEEARDMLESMTDGLDPEEAETFWFNSRIIEVGVA